uniref:Uncharacterized protein n=1 Tax=viral metagenome TaxID=1070528 RepID=A0A6C0EK38_9ZZZZ
MWSKEFRIFEKYYFIIVYYINKRGGYNCPKLVYYINKRGGYNCQKLVTTVNT